MIERDRYIIEETTTPEVTDEKSPDALPEWTVGHIESLLPEPSMIYSLSLRDKEFLINLSTKVISIVYGGEDKKVFVDPLTGKQIRRTHISHAYAEMMDHDSIASLAQEIEISPDRLRTDLGIFKKHVKIAYKNDFDFRNTMDTAVGIHVSQRDFEDEVNSIEMLDVKIRLADVTRILYEKGVLTEGEFYSLSVLHLGTVVFSREEPTGDSEADVEKRRKRALVTQDNLDSALEKISTRYRSKKRAARAPRSNARPLNIPSAEFYFEMLLGSRVDSLRPLRREEIAQKSRTRSSSIIVEHDDTTIEANLVRALMWTYNMHLKEGQIDERFSRANS